MNTELFQIKWEVQAKSLKGTHTSSVCQASTQQFDGFSSSLLSSKDEPVNCTTVVKFLILLFC